MLAISECRGRSPGAIVLMRGLVRGLLASGVLPYDAAVAPIERHHDVPMNSPRIDAAERCVRLGHAGARRNRREHEHPISPDDWRSRAPARNLDLPPDV